MQCRAPSTDRCNAAVGRGFGRNVLVQKDLVMCAFHLARDNRRDSPSRPRLAQLELERALVLMLEPVAVSFGGWLTWCCSWRDPLQMCCPKKRVEKKGTKPRKVCEMMCGESRGVEMVMGMVLQMSRALAVQRCRHQNPRGWLLCEPDSSGRCRQKAKWLPAGDCSFGVRLRAPSQKRTFRFIP